jgi:hypothetical protein
LQKIEEEKNVTITYSNYNVPLLMQKEIYRLQCYCYDGKKNFNFSWVTLQKTGLQDVLALAKDLFTAALQGAAVLLAVTSRIVTGYLKSKCTKPSPYLLPGYSYFPKKSNSNTKAGNE